jgi:hypothetical protein
VHRKPCNLPEAHRHNSTEDNPIALVVAEVEAFQRRVQDEVDVKPYADYPSGQGRRLGHLKVLDQPRSEGEREIEVGRRAQNSVAVEDGKVQKGVARRKERVIDSIVIVMTFAVVLAKEQV